VIGWCVVGGSKGWLDPEKSLAFFFKKKEKENVFFLVLSILGKKK
jgi:hypothetical protein